MPILIRRESIIRELHEDDTVLEGRLVDKTAQAQAAYERIVADGRVDASDGPDILRVLKLVPEIHAEAAESLECNRRINGLYCDLASKRYQWRKRDDDDPEPSAAALEMAA